MLRRPGSYELRDAETLERWLGIDPSFDRASFVASDDSTLTFTLVVESDDDEHEHDVDDPQWSASTSTFIEPDDPSRALWLVPVCDWHQQVTLTAPGGSIEQDYDGIEEEDRERLTDQGWLVDEWSSSEVDGAVCVELRMRPPGTPNLRLTGTRKAGIVALVREPVKQVAESRVDADRVALWFSQAPALRMDGLAGIASTRLDPSHVGEIGVELRRTVATPEAFVEILRQAGESEGFLRAVSGDETFDGDVWLDYVTPHRRP